MAESTAPARQLLETDTASTAVTDMTASAGTSETGTETTSTADPATTDTTTAVTKDTGEYSLGHCDLVGKRKYWRFPKAFLASQSEYFTKTFQDEPDSKCASINLKHTHPGALAWLIADLKKHLPAFEAGRVIRRAPRRVRWSKTISTNRMESFLDLTMELGLMKLHRSFMFGLFEQASDMTLLASFDRDMAKWSLQIMNYKHLEGYVDEIVPSIVISCKERERGLNPDYQFPFNVLFRHHDLAQKVLAAAREEKAGESGEEHH